MLLVLLLRLLLRLQLRLLRKQGKQQLVFATRQLM
jgi:hypothetical protein